VSKVVSSDEIKITVFNKGILYGLNEIILTGGQDWPISIAGNRDEWK